MPILTHTRRRQGFTLVELLVAAALCVIIMSVMATVFQLSIDTMRQLRSTTDMADQLRAATEVMRLDLQNDHFVAGSSSFNQTTTLSGQQLDATTVNSAGTTTFIWAPPAGGFFRIISNSGTQEMSTNTSTNPTLVAATDANSLSSFRTDGNAGTTGGNLLHFTSIAATGLDRDLYTANIVNSTTSTTGPPMNSQAAEIAYFLVAMAGGPTTSGTSPLPLFTLIRRQRLVAMNPTVAGQMSSVVAFQMSQSGTVFSSAPGLISLKPPIPTTLANLSSTPPNVNSLTDVQNPLNRLGGATSASGPVATPTTPNLGGLPADATMAAVTSTPGDDFLLSNVISFDVRVLWTIVDPNTGINNTASKNLPLPFVNTSTGAIINSEHPFDALANNAPNGFEFDTRLNASGSPLNAIRVRAVQIRIRIWDPKLQNARQTTITQAL